MNNTTNIDKKIAEGFIGQRMIVLPPNVIRQIVANPLIKSLYLTAIGFYPKAAYHDRERNTGVGQYILLYCVDGDGQVNIGDSTHHLKPNTYIIIPKNTRHRYASSNTNPWSIYWVHFGGSNADAIHHRYKANDEIPVRAIAYNQTCVNLFEQVYNLLDSSFHTNEMEAANLCLLQFLTLLVYDKELNPVLYDKDSINLSIAYMKSEISKKLLIDDLAAHCGLSVSHYSRLFNQRTGSSPINYFNLLKIQAACQHLYFTDKSVKEIAAAMGFDDQYYFSRLFAKLIGVSPMKYRKTHKKL